MRFRVKRARQESLVALSQGRAAFDPEWNNYTQAGPREEGGDQGAEDAGMSIVAARGKAVKAKLRPLGGKGPYHATP